MKMKMENPDKIANLVKGQQTQLNEIYLPLLLEIQENGLIKFENCGHVHFERSNKNVQQLLDDIPQTLKIGLKKSALQQSLYEL